MAARFLAVSVLLFSVWFFPWWLTLIFCLLFISYFKNFYEALIPALVFDLLYGVPLQTGLWGLSLFKLNFAFTVSTLFFLVILEWLKEKFVFWQDSGII